MRVIGGEFRSRRLKSIPGLAARPTPDRLRETLFDILQMQIADATFVDAYAGTGAVGIEALSRGARHAWFIEKARASIEAIRANLASLGLEARATVVTAPVLLALERHPADIVFLDPPYEMAREYGTALVMLGREPSGLVVVQHSVRTKLEERYGSLGRTRTVRQSDNALSFYRPGEP
jgi:16S rRNA (guanine(966)-N(2))-methyltransferase RsmD